jgi:hypothetical protein
LSAAPASPTALGLPLPDARAAWAAFLVVLVYLVATMQRDLGLLDSAELAMVAQSGGLGHPTGQPLHTMLGWLFARLPGLTPLFGLNLLSALPAALCVFPILSLARAMSAEPSAPAPQGTARLAPALTAAAYLLHPAVWEPATRVEVYALAAFCALWASARAAASLVSLRPQGLFAAGLAFGFAASANPFMGVAAVLSITPALLLATRRGLPFLASAARVIAGGVAGLLPYAYVFAVADRTDVFVWEGDDLARFFSGADYAHNRGQTWMDMLRHAWDWALGAATTGHLPFLLVGAGAGLAARRGLSLLTPVTLAFCVYVFALNVIFFADNPDYLGYLMLPSACAAAGLAALWPRSPRVALPASLGLVGLLCLQPPALHARTRPEDTVARELTQPVLDAVPPEGILLVESDHYAFPLLYLQRVEGRRPDVVILVDGLLDSSWYWRLTYAWHPALRPIELGGPHAARVGRFFAAHPERGVFAERGALAGLAGRPFCVGPHMLQTQCGSDPMADAAAETRRLADLHAQAGPGAPLTENVLAAVGATRGELLWHMGRAPEALAALLAGVPPDLRPAQTDAPLEAPPLRAALPEWQAPVMLGEPARNLYLAGLLLESGGQRAAAAEHVRAAADLGLPEAQSAFEP